MTVSDPDGPANVAASRAASFRTFVVARSQEGAPGQAAMRRRGSSGSRMNEYRSNSADSVRACSTDGTGIKIARQGVRRSSWAPIVPAEDARSAKSRAAVRPKGRPRPRNPAVPNECTPRKAGAGPCAQYAALKKAAVRLHARSFQHRARRPDRACGECCPFGDAEIRRQERRRPRRPFRGGTGQGNSAGRRRDGS